MIVIPNELSKYMETPSGCPKYDKNNPDYRCSVKYDRTDYRKNKAKSESEKDVVPIMTIQELIGNFLDNFNIKNKGILIEGQDLLMTINYDHILRQFNLKKQSDIIWMKFTTDGYLGVIASSNDINFDEDNSSGKLINYVGKKWDNCKIIIIPLHIVNERSDRLLIEKMLGNYLIEKKVPILDYYSHNLGV